MVIWLAHYIASYVKFFSLVNIANPNRIPCAHLTVRFNFIFTLKLFFIFFGIIYGSSLEVFCSSLSARPYLMAAKVV